MNRAQLFKRGLALVAVAAVPPRIWDSIPAEASAAPEYSLLAGSVSEGADIVIRSAGSYFSLGDIVRKTTTGEILQVTAVHSDGISVRKWGR